MIHYGKLNWYNGNLPDDPYQSSYGYAGSEKQISTTNYKIYPSVVSEDYADQTSEKSSQVKPIEYNFRKITLCGSTKFKEYFLRYNRILTLEYQAVVYSVAFFGHADDLPITSSQKELLDQIHFAKIFNSDEIFVLNVNDYIGESTRKEIEYAQELGKTITYLTEFNPSDAYIKSDNFKLGGELQVNIGKSKRTTLTDEY